MIVYLDRGCSRHVFGIGQHVVKVPRVDLWDRFLRGLQGNMQEAAYGRARWPELCPVAAALPGGFVLVMRRARVCSSADFPEAQARSMCERAAASGRHVSSVVELKPDSWGWLDGRLVAIDYGG